MYDPFIVVPDIIVVSDNELYAGYLREAYRIAWEKSHDPSTKTGSIIAIQNVIVASGYNHFPPGVNPTPEQLADSMWKRNNIEHAETDNINKAKSKGYNIEGALQAMPWTPCKKPCSYAIVDNKIGTFLGHEDMVRRSPDDWKPSLDEGLLHMRNNGVKIMMYRGKIGGVKSLFRNVEWEP